MKIKIDNKVCEISLWDFLKCHVIAELILLGIVYGLIGILTLILL